MVRLLSNISWLLAPFSPKFHCYLVFFWNFVLIIVCCDGRVKSGCSLGCGGWAELATRWEKRAEWSGGSSIIEFGNNGTTAKRFSPLNCIFSFNFSISLSHSLTLSLSLSLIHPPSLHSTIVIKQAFNFLELLRL